MKSPIREARRTAPWLVASLLACGCGGGDGLERVAVSGKVTLDGKPLERGEIQFIPKGGDSRGAASGQIASGEYSIRASEGPAPGTFDVSILPNAVAEAPAAAAGASNEAPGDPPADATGPDASATYTPTSPLEATVASGRANTFDFGLTTNRGRRTRRP